MTGVYIISDNIFSPLGANTADNFAQLKKGVSGIKLHDNKTLANAAFYASLFEDKGCIDAVENKYTFFEQLLIASVGDALQKSDINPADKKTALIISSTKGNIGLLQTGPDSPALQKRIALPMSANFIAAYFGVVNRPIVVSNACISGLVAILTGKRLIESGQYENVVVAGADVISKFILSGFQAFNAISPTPCRPFDADRDGITLGEGAATIILSSNRKSANDIKVIGGAVSNDANHISAPSRTGEELAYAIKKAMDLAHLLPGDIDFISAHGTATVYNDEMEAKAIALAQLQNVSVNSLKGHYGHTLGAAGLIESVISLQSLREGVFLPTLGFKEQGMSTPVNICKEAINREFKNFLKTASGFGGCNAAAAFGLV